MTTKLEKFKPDAPTRVDPEYKNAMRLLQDAWKTVYLKGGKSDLGGDEVKNGTLSLDGTFEPVPAFFANNSETRRPVVPILQTQKGQLPRLLLLTGCDEGVGADVNSAHVFARSMDQSLAAIACLRGLLAERLSSAIVHPSVKSILEQFSVASGKPLEVSAAKSFDKWRKELSQAMTRVSIVYFFNKFVPVDETSTSKASKVVEQIVASAHTKSSTLFRTIKEELGKHLVPTTLSEVGSGDLSFFTEGPRRAPSPEVPPAPAAAPAAPPPAKKARLTKESLVGVGNGLADDGLGYAADDPERTELERIERREAKKNQKNRMFVGDDEPMLYEDGEDDLDRAERGATSHAALLAQQRMEAEPTTGDVVNKMRTGRSKRRKVEESSDEEEEEDDDDDDEEEDELRDSEDDDDDDDSDDDDSDDDDEDEDEGEGEEEPEGEDLVNKLAETASSKPKAKKQKSDVGAQLEKLKPTLRRIEQLGDFSNTVDAVRGATTEAAALEARNKLIVALVAKLEETDDGATPEVLRARIAAGREAMEGFAFLRCELEDVAACCATLNARVQGTLQQSQGPLYSIAKSSRALVPPSAE